MSTDLQVQARTQKVKIILSHLVGKLGSSIFSFGIGLMILRETGSASNFGFSQIIGPIVALLLLPLTGSIVDKFHHKKIVIIGQIASITGVILFLLGNSFQVLPKLLLIYILLTILTIADLFLETAYSSSLISMVAEEEVQKMMSQMQIVSTCVMIAAPIIGAVLYNVLSFEQFVLMEIGSEILTLFIILGINFYLFKERKAEDRVQASQGLKEIWRMFGEGLAYVRRSSTLMFAVTYSMFMNVVFACFMIGLPFVQIQHFKFTNTQFGITEMAFSIGILGASLMLARKKEFGNPLYSAWKLVFLIFADLSLMAGLVFLNLTQWLSFAGMTALSLLLGGMLAAVNIPMQVWMTKSVPQNMQGRIFNLLGTLSQVLKPLGILLFGALFDSGARPDMIFILSAIVGVIMSTAIPLALGVKLRELGNQI